jgi:antitoxin YefM
MRIVSQSEFRANLSKLLDQVEEDSDELIVTRTGGRQHMAIIPLAELESWRETIHLMSSRANAEKLNAAIARLNAGGGRRKSMKELGIED